MPALMTPPKVETHAAEVGEQLAQAAGKIRLHDLTVGGLLMASGLLAYVALMMTLDKWLDLDAWVRQLGWCGLAGFLAFIGYRFLLKPLRNAVNPLYAAKLMESTLPDAKNSVVNWVDLHEKEIPESVRNAVSAKAAKQLAHADLNRAIESRWLISAGSAVAALVVVLAVLFLLFKPAVFLSLVGRTLNPFSSSAIATRTALTLTQPAGGDVTITAGQPLTIGVTVTGREPDVNAPDRLRAILRHNPADPNGEEINLQPIGNGEWSVQVPQHLIQHGFLYRVVGSDATTPEYKVTVRPRPVFTDFEIKYEYPAYLNIPPETSRDPHIEAYRGTVITITAKANRDLKDGRMVIADVPQPITGEVAGDTLKVRFTLMENGSYRLFFTAATDEVNADAPPYLLRVITDAPPVVTFKPTQPESITLPINALLAIDGEATDDFGVDSITLKMVANGKPLPDRPYRGGKSFRRETDNTWPTKVEYKDSVKLDDLKVAVGTTVEYWLEAKDNCTVPKANVGKSKVMKVHLGPAAEADAKKVQQRRSEEADHGQSQDAKNNTEARSRASGPQEKKAKPEEGKAEPGKDSSEPGKPDATKPANDAAKPEKNPNDPQQPQASEQPQQGASDAAKPSDADLKQKADRIKDELDKQKSEGGQAKAGDAPPANQPPPEPGQKKDGANDPQNPPTEAKPMGNQPKGGDPAQEKNAGAKPQPQNQGDAKSGEKNEGTGASEDKGSPKSDPMKSGEEKQSPGDGGSSTNKPNPGETRGSEKPEPGETKKGPGEPKPAEEKAAPKPGSGDESQGNDTGEAKNQSPPKASASKHGDKKNGSDANSEAKDAGAPKPGDSAATPKEPGANSPEKAGSSKPNPQDENQLSRENGGKENSTPSEKPLDHEQLFRDLQSKDQAAKAKAEKQLEDELRKKKKQEQQQSGGDGGEKSPSGQDVADAAKDLKSGNSAKNNGAGKTLEKAMQQQAKADAEKMEKDLKSDNPETKAAAEKQLEELKKKSQGNPQGGGDAKDIADAAKDLNSPDAAKRQAAEQKIDKAVGENARKEAQQLAKDLQSNDKATREAAEKKVEAIKRKAEEMAKDQPQGNGGQQPDAKDIAEAAKDVNSKDARKQQAAKEKLNQAEQQKARQEADQLKKDLQSGNPATKAAAEQKLDAMKKQAEENAKNQKGSGDPKPVDPKELVDAAKDLNSPDPAKKKAAGENIDRAARENAKKEADQLAKDLQSKDPATKAAAEKKVEDLKKQAEAVDQALSEQAEKEGQQLAKDLQSNDPATKAAARKKFNDLLDELDKYKNPKSPQATPEQVNKAKDLAKDLNSPDADKREQAEKGLDDMLGKENRDKLQQQMKDEAKPGEPLPQGVGQQIDELAKSGSLRSGSKDQASKPLEADPDFAKRSGQLQLERLKKEQANKELLKKLGWTKEDYDRFLKGYEEMLNRQEAAKAENTKPNTIAGVERRNTSGASKVETRAGAATGSPQASGTATAPPGYSDAQKRFLDAARKSQDN